MPYEYRNLTPKDRKNILQQRRERGFPLHAPPHPIRAAGYYFITAANYEHTPVMGMPERRTEFEAALLDAMCLIQADVYGWVVLPNHYHLLAGIETLDAVSQALKNLHGATSRAWNMDDGQTGKRKVWYKFTDRMIRDDTHFYRAMNYLHYNPVKHGYIADAYDWPWSSLGAYVEQAGRDWLSETWKRYPPAHFGDGWDD